MIRRIIGTSAAGVKIALQSISIDPTISATIHYQYISNTDGIKNYEFIIDGQQYREWGADDTIIYHIVCARHNLTYVPYVEPQYYDEVMVYKNPQGQFVTKTIQRQNPNYVTP
jgi:hypothetical protein